MKKKTMQEQSQRKKFLKEYYIIRRIKKILKDFGINNITSGAIAEYILNDLDDLGYDIILRKLGVKIVRPKNAK